LSELNGHEKQYVRKKRRDSGVRALGESRAMKAFSEETHGKLATAFLDMVDDRGDEPLIDDYDTYCEFKRRAQGYGVPIVVVMFLLNVAFQLLLEWWRRRNPVT
jgi:hypothetical protein